MADLCTACNSLCSSLDALDGLCSSSGAALHGRIADLQRSAQTGCPLCKMLSDPQFCVDEIAQCFFADTLIAGKRLPDETNVRLRGLRGDDGVVGSILLEIKEVSVCPRKDKAPSALKVRNPKAERDLARAEKSRHDLLDHDDLKMVRALMMALEMTGDGNAPSMEGCDNYGRKFQLSGHSGLVEVPDSPSHDPSERADSSSGKDSEWALLMSLNVRIVTEAEIKNEPFRHDSPHALKSMNKWISWCGNHPKCAFHVKPTLPKRVLDVGKESDSSVRLVETATGRRDRYVTLSYCWGGKQAVVTTRSNVDAHRAAIELSTLPQTIVDAVSITRGLGIMFLWIDALCICQDDDTEKALEIAKMDKYYKNSFLTIVAANASRAADGFLSPSLDEVVCDIPYAKSDATLCTARLSYITQDLDQTETTALKEIARASVKTPINMRGWCFQEAILSRRTLRFGIDRVEWRCQEQRAHYAQRLKNGKVYIDDKMDLIHSQDTPEFDFFAPDDYEPSMQTIITSWDEALEEYSARFLTVPGDKLPGFSAVAQEYHRVTGDTYVAGIWMERLVLDLLWLMDRPDQALGRVPLHFRRMDEPEIAVAPNPRAPSWSWASMDGKIKKYQPFNTSIESAIVTYGYKVQPNILEAPFGEVKPCGYLWLDAMIKRVPPKTVEDEDQYWATRFPFFPFEDHGVVYFDLGAPETWATCEAWYLWLITTRALAADGTAVDESDEPEASGLVIAPMTFGATNTFRRIGMFKEAPASWFDGTIRQRIQLV